MGTDVRKLVADGYPGSNVIGCDLRQEFLDYGYKFYQDKDTCPIHFFASDVFDVPYPFPADKLPPPPSSSPPSSVVDDVSSVEALSQLHGSVTHFYTGALFHLFDESTQYAIALRVATLLKRVPGAVVFGRHQGNEEAGMLPDHMARWVLFFFVQKNTKRGRRVDLALCSRTRYGHSPASWPLMWKKVFSEIESPEFAENHVKVDAVLTQGFNGHMFMLKGRARMLVWSVSIV